LGDKLKDMLGKHIKPENCSDMTMAKITLRFRASSIILGAKLTSD